MNLKHWCELDELIYISQTDEEYKQYAGLEYNEKLTLLHESDISQLTLKPSVKRE